MEANDRPEALIPLFNLERVLNQGCIPPKSSKLDIMLMSILDQNGRRVSLLGTIVGQPALLIAERAAFPSDEATLQAFHAALHRINNIGNNDIYSWHLASSGTSQNAPADLKLNLIYPCTEKHIKKYSSQELRMVTETPEIYARYVRPYMQRMRDEGRLNWVFNILEGKAEQEDIILRVSGTGRDGENEGFLLAPDLNWDRKTMTSLHLLAMVDRRDIWSLRDLRKGHIGWLKRMREKVLDATTKVYERVEEDQIKLYMHCKSCLPRKIRPLGEALMKTVDQPTYYHFHIHVVHVMCEATSTQAVGKAFGLENIISQLENMEGGHDASLADVVLTYYLGTASDLWTDIFQPLKEGRKAVTSLRVT